MSGEGGLRGSERRGGVSGTRASRSRTDTHRPTRPNDGHAARCSRENLMRISLVSVWLVCCLLAALPFPSLAGSPPPLITHSLIGDGPLQARVGESILLDATGLASPVRVFFSG